MAEGPEVLGHGEAAGRDGHLVVDLEPGALGGGAPADLATVAVALEDVEAQARRHERALVLARGLVAGALFACDEGLNV